MAEPDDERESAGRGNGQSSGETIVLRDLPGGLAVSSRPAAIDRDLQRVETLRGTRPGDQYLRLSRHRDFRRVRAGYLVPRESIERRRSAPGRLYTFVKRLLVGRPLTTAEESEERV